MVDFFGVFRAVSLGGEDDDELLLSKSSSAVDNDVDDPARFVT